VSKTLRVEIYNRIFPTRNFPGRASSRARNSKTTDCDGRPKPWSRKNKGTDSLSGDVKKILVTIRILWTGEK